MSRLTSRSLASGASLNDLIHIVITGDTSQSAQGSSYKATLSQLQPLFLFSGGSGNCITNLYVDNIRACTNEITVFNRVQSTGSDAQNTLSFAWGLTNVASGNYSFAFGTGTTASGLASHAEGIDTIASGYGSHAEGQGTIASGARPSHAEGYLTVASGSSSHAEGAQSIAGGSSSHAEGNNTRASGSASHAEGNLSIASGTTSHAEGDSTIAGGQASHSEGYSTNASGDYSHAEGYGSASSGSFSHAQNKTTTSRGSSSHAGGNQSITDGPNSFVHGFINYVGGESTAVLGGQYNSILSGSTNNSGIFGGERNSISGATPSDPVPNSVIIGGSGNTVTHSNSAIIASENSKLLADHSVILGGYNITGTTTETVYVPKIRLVTSGTPSSSADTQGEPGSLLWDNTYFYFKTNIGWRRISGATW
jgi:hypothetical protein